MSEASPQTIKVEVVYADTQRQIARRAELAIGATVEDAVRISAICEAMPGHFSPVAYGIFGRVVTEDTALRDGDRIELYRPLKIDPKQARRRRAEKQKWG